jgi:hypothetical protein
MLDLGFGARHHLMGFEKLLNIVDARRQWIVIMLGRTNLHHVHHDLGILRVVFVLSVVQCLTGLRQTNRGDQADIKAGIKKSPGNGAVVITCRFKGNHHGMFNCRQDSNETVVFLSKRPWPAPKKVAHP